MPSWKCLGTRAVVLAGGSPKEGLLVVEEEEEDDDDDDDNDGHSAKNGEEDDDEKKKKGPISVKIRIGTSNKIYKGTIKLSHVKLANKENLASYLLQDGREHPDIVISFQHDDQFAVGSLKVLIQQRLMSSGLMKTAFSGILKPETRASSSFRREDEETSVLAFCQSLGQAVNDSQSEIERLKVHLKDTKKALSNWKDTAEKLDKEVWQREKDELLDNFLKLWNEQKARSKDRITQLEREVETLKAEASSSGTSTKRRALQLDAPDDLDQMTKEPISLDQVSALAEGRKVQNTVGRKPILDASNTVSIASLNQQQEEYRKRKAQKTTKAKQKQTSNDDKDDSTRPTKRRHKSVASPGTSPEEEEMVEDSEDEAMRQAIRASIRKNNDDDSDTDVSI